MSGIKKKIKASHGEGIANGFSNFSKNIIFMAIYMVGSALTLKDSTIDPVRVMQAIWALLMGAF